MIAEEKDDSKQTPSKVTQHVIKAVTVAQSMQKHQNAQWSRSSRAHNGGNCSSPEGSSNGGIGGIERRKNPTRREEKKNGTQCPPFHSFSLAVVPPIGKEAEAVIQRELSHKCGSEGKGLGQSRREGGSGTDQKSMGGWTILRRNNPPPIRGTCLLQVIVPNRSTPEANCQITVHPGKKKKNKYGRISNVTHSTVWKMSVRQAKRCTCIRGSLLPPSPYEKPRCVSNRDVKQLWGGECN